MLNNTNNTCDGVASGIAEKSHVVNPLNFVYNKSGKPRLVLFCRHINPNVVKFKFKYEGLQTVDQMFAKGIHFFTYDSKWVHHHIEISGEQRKYLGFCWVPRDITKDSVFQFFTFYISTVMKTELIAVK